MIRHGIRTIAMGAAAAAVALLALAGSAAAQGFDTEDPALLDGLRIWKSNATCVLCHSWDGMGQRVKEMENLGVNFDAPELVNTILEREDIIEAVRCGRIDSIMPKHDRRSWTNELNCYGMTIGDVPTELRPFEPLVRWLREEQIQNVTDYLIAMYKSGPMTKAKCQFYWQRDDARQCEAYD